MSILSDQDIERALRTGRIVVLPAPDVKAIQPETLDIRLGNILKDEDGEVIEPTGYTEDGRPYWDLQRFDTALGSTIEWVELPKDLCARLDGKSTRGRQFTLVHVSAGHIDAEFRGHVTVEFVNLSKKVRRLVAGQYICQLVFEELTSPSRGYKGRYQDQGPEPQVAIIKDDD